MEVKISLGRRIGRGICARGVAAAVLLGLGSGVLAAVPTAEVLLWPGPPPGSEGLDLSDRIVERSADPALPDRYADKIGKPGLTVFQPARPDGRAVLVIPGGGYQRVVLDKEGTALVPALAEEAGLTLFVLRYRLPGEGHRNAADVPLVDAQRALRLIRARAQEWGIDPATVGVMGFSAGGHVAASLATRHAETVYAPIDAIDAQSTRPAWAVLVYPVIDMGSHAHPGSRRNLLGLAPEASSVRRYSIQERVDASTPPVFLLHAQDDDVVSVDNSLLLAQSLRRHGVEHELHVYAQGGHGFGVRAATRTLALWPQLASAWIRTHAEISEAFLPVPSSKEPTP